MKVALCKDTPIQTRFLSFTVLNWAKRNMRHVAIHTFCSANEFLFDWGEDKSFDVLLLRHPNAWSSGLDPAKSIRTGDDGIQIIFVTGSEYMPEGYEVSALHYLVWPVKEDQLLTCLDRASKRVEMDTRTMLFAHDGQSI